MATARISPMKPCFFSSVALTAPCARTRSAVRRGAARAAAGRACAVPYVVRCAIVRASIVKACEDAFFTKAVVLAAALPRAGPWEAKQCNHQIQRLAPALALP
jgi:hypothetical protein